MRLFPIPLVQRILRKYFNETRNDFYKMIAAVINEDTVGNIFKSLDGARECDAIELRLDFLKAKDIENVRENLADWKIKYGKIFIITIRKKGEGGFFNGSEEERLLLLKSFLGIADYIDIEFSSGKSTIKDFIKNKKSTKIIASFHDFEKTPNDIDGLYSQIKKTRPDTIKIATKANSVIDNFKILELIKKAKNYQEIIAFCMGSYGDFSRILSIMFGSKLTYAALSKGRKVAEGQLTLSEMVCDFRARKINDKTKISGLIGNPVLHSWSHVMHNSAFESLYINAVYLKFRVDKLEDFIRYFRKQNLLGFAVTIPHKTSVIDFLDEIDDAARAIGAVNTIVNQKGRLIGHNTDCEGAMQALGEKTELNGKKAVVLGAGGSARAIAFGLKQNNAEVLILNRTLENAKAIADDLKCSYGKIGKLGKMDYDILINTTPVGMHPKSNESPIPKKFIKKGSIVMDIVFNPFYTMLLKDAKSLGCITIPGIEMLIKGNVMQSRLWTGKQVSESLMRKRVLEISH